MEWSTREHEDRFITPFDYFPELSRFHVEVVPMDDWLTDHNLEGLHFIHQSDIIRIYQLWKEGGVWSDMDILYVKNMEVEFTGSKDILFFKPYYFPVGMLVAQPHSVLFQRVFEHQLSLFHIQTQYQIYGVNCLTRFLSENQPLLANAEVRPAEVYLPADWRQLDGLFHSCILPLPAITVGVHWFNGSQPAQRYMKQLHVGHFEPKCTMDTLVMDYLEEFKG